MAASDYEPSDGLLKKGKKTTAKNVQTECSKSDKKEDHKQLNQLLDQLLDPRKPISDSEIIEWLRWLIAGGSSPDDYAQSVKEHDNATTCGLVWTANFVAYRCRTCGISPCMSLCAECFQKGDHEGHDFNMFRSQAGGACDCGDPSVMKEQGFCVRHGPKASKSTPCPPSGLLCVAKAMLPRLLHRLLVQLRKNNADALKEADGFITNILTQMTDMGAAMRTVMSEILISPEIYSSLSNKCDARELEMSVILHDRFENYVSAKKAMTSFKPAAGFLRDCTICNKDVCVISGFEKELVHNSYAEEFLFWTIVYEFPQKLVCFLLNMLPDIRYKEAFAESFVHHYSRVSIMLAKFRNLDDTPGTNRPSAHDLLSNCVVHVSVQLFSNETLAAKLCREQHLLHVIIASLRATVEGSPSVTGAADDVRGILTPSRLQVASRNRHQVVRCDHYIMRKHSYWPLVSDLNNILTHSPVAHMFMGDSTIFQMWLEFVLNFQGMNLNIRELDEHVEYENESYYAAFSAELEICATPIWTLISHLRDDSTWRLSNNVIRQTQECLEKWFDLISFTNYDTPNAYQATFHFPLHRYYAIFLHHAVQRQSLSLSSLLPFCESKLQLYLAHPLQVLVAFYEILCGLWVRNGLQMKGQAMTYIQCHFCNSMVDPDLFLIQQCASRLSPDWFIQTVLERFHVWDWLSLSPNQDQSYRRAPLEPDQIMPMLEGALTFLSTFFSVRTNLGLSEEEVTRQEMVTLLTMGDRTHSQLMDLLPEKCGTTSQTKDFEKMLARVADYRAPSLESGGNLSQGTFSPKSDVWEDEFDPIHVLLRAVHRRDYQASMDRYTTHMKQNGKWPSTSLPWPPFRQPKDADGSKFIDPRKVLYSKVLHGVLFTILYKAMYVCDVTDQVLALAVYLLEMSLSYPSSESTSPVPSIGEMSSPLYVQDRKFSDWFTSESILVNFNTNIQMVTCPNVYHERDSVALSCSQESDGPSVEEMEVDLHSSSNEDDDEYMSADEGFDNDAIHMGIEAAPPTQSLAGSTVPLALMPPTPSPSDTLSPSTSQVVVMNSGTTPVVQSTTPTDERRSIVSAPGRVAITGSPNATTTIALRSPLLLTRSNARRIRGRNRPRYNMNQRSLENYPTEVHSAPTGFFQQTGSCMFALPSSSSSTSSLSHSTVTVNESILSLLINLHSKLTNESDSYKPGPMNESRIGDGPYFIKRLIDLYVKLNVSSGQKSVENWRERLWPKPELPLDDPLASSSSGTSGATDETEEEKNARLKEERRRKARERQQKLMAEFASKQMAFMRNMEKEQADTGGDMEEEPKAETEEESSFVKMPEYECVICNQTCPSTVDRLMGMVTLLQSTSVLAHSRPSHRIRRPEDKENSDHALPCEESQLKKNSSRWTLAKYMEKKIDYLSIEFPSSWFNALSIGWEGGVHVQTCGHYLHLDCHKSYLKSLRTTHGTRHGLEQGEYACPLCRQMANSVLPVTPDIGQYGAMVHSRNPFDAKAVAQEITDLLTNVQPPNANLIKLLGGFMEDLTKATPPQFRSIRANPTTQSLFLFLCSIIRTNIEAEVLVRLSKSSQSGLKKSFVYLFHVLALNAKVFIHQPYTPIWSQLTGLPLPDDEAMIISQMDKEVPVLLKDVTSLLIQLIFSVPLNVDKAYYTGIVQMLYNLNFVQAMVQQSCAMQDSERQRLREVYLSGQKDGLGSDSSFLWNISSFLGVLIDILSHSSLYERTETEPSVVQKVLTSGELVDAASSVCLPFMRAASVLQSHLYGDNYPSAIEVDGDNEFDTLRTFLGLHDQQLKGVVSVLGAANWPNQLPLKVIKSWCQELIQFVQVSLITSRKLLLDKPITLETPSLLRLPHTYDQLFLFYHSLKCSKCNRTPKEPCVCLVCGTLVCMREQCCRSSSSQTLEAVSHSEVCGAGTTIYLAINSSTIIVIRGKRACVWGSVYLDSYGEEDRDLKRGKPLYLSEQRYHILEQQWLTHSFDHTNKRWVWHKDGL